MHQINYIHYYKYYKLLHIFMASLARMFRRKETHQRPFAFVVVTLIVYLAFKGALLAICRVSLKNKNRVLVNDTCMNSFKLLCTNLDFFFITGMLYFNETDERGQCLCVSTNCGEKKAFFGFSSSRTRQC